jgi:hypothetical protein
MYTDPFNARSKPTLPPPAWRYITAAQAATMLPNVSENRAHKTHVVKEYTRLMRNGLWRLSPHGIVLQGVEGPCIDGSHRLRALIASGMDGAWFLVAIWPMPASELRVDRGSTRTLRDFSGLEKRTAEAMAVIATLCSIGNGNTRDPEEMKPVIRAFADVSERLTEACASTRRGIDAKVRAAFVLAAKRFAENEDRIFSDYRNLMLNNNLRSPACVSLSNQIDNMAMDSSEKLCKAYIAAISPECTRITLKDIPGKMAEIRDVARALIALAS